MSILDPIEQFATIIIAAVNIILVFFVFLQIRDSRKPFVTTGLVSSDKLRKMFELEQQGSTAIGAKENKTFWDDVNVQESGYLIFFIRNDSKNLVKKVDLVFNFQVGTKTFEYTEKRLSHLNPKEITYVSLKMDKLIEKFPDLFTEFDVFNNVGDLPEETYSIKFPKEELSIELSVIISHNPVILDFLPIKIEDNYSLRWGTYDNDELLPNMLPDLVGATPRIICWNRRNGEYYIYKMQIRDVV